jgi:hypothetical protein
MRTDAAWNRRSLEQRVLGSASVAAVPFLLRLIAQSRAITAANLRSTST